MTSALFFNIPAHGHIVPSLPLVTELARRGHAITYFASEGFRGAIEATGATFRAYASVRDDFFTARGLSGKVPQKVAYELMATAQAILPDLLETARAMQPDYVMFDGMCPWGYFVARALRAPAVTSLGLLPPASPTLRAMLRPELLRFIASALFKDFGKGLAANRISRELGRQYDVAPLGQQSLMGAIGDIAISYTSAQFAPFADTVSKAVRFVGWTPHESKDRDASSIPAGSARSLIYVSLGTLNNDDGGFFRACIDAFAESPHDLLISTGGNIDPGAFGALPANVSVRAWVPQVAVLRRAALFITHGGLNSAHDGLYFGLPLLLVPQQGEQAFTAMRVAELGAGLVLEKSRVTVAAISAAAQRLLSDPRFKGASQRLGESLRAGGGASKAADEVESLIKQPRQ